MKSRVKSFSRMEIPKNFEMLQSLYDGVVLYNTCQEYHFVIEPEQAPENLAEMIDMKEPFFIITSLSEKVQEMMDGNYDKDNYSTELRSLPPFERKLYAYLKVIPASVMKTNVLDAEGNQKVMFGIYPLEKMSALVLSPLLKSEQVDFLLTGKKSYFNPEKKGELVQKKITF